MGGPQGVNRNAPRLPPPVGRWVAPLAVALGAIALQLPVFDRWASFFDEAHVLLYAQLLVEGGELYRDAVAYPLPGAFYLLAAVFRLFGASILVARWLVVLEFALFAALAFLVARRTLSTPAALLGLPALAGYRIWCFPHWQIYSYSSTALLLLCGALLAFLLFLERRRLLPLAAAGLLVALAVVTKQDYGGMGLLAFEAVLLLFLRETRPAPRDRLHCLLAFHAPLAAVAAILLGYYASQGALLDMLHQTLWQHLSGMASFPYPSLPALLPLFEQSGELRDTRGLFLYTPALLNTLDLEGLRQHPLYRNGIAWDLALKLFFYAPYGLCAGAGLLLLRRWRRADRLARPGLCAPLAVFGLALALLLVMSLVKPQDFVHVIVLYPPFLWAGLLLLDALWRRRGKLAWGLVALLLLAALPLGYHSARLHARLRSVHDTALELPRAGIRVQAHEARTLQELVAWIRSRVPPDERLAAMPFHPLALFLAERWAPHRSAYNVWPAPDYVDREARITEALEGQQVGSLVWSFEGYVAMPPFEVYAPELFAYLVDHYRIDRVFSHAPLGMRLAGLVRSPVPAGTQLSLEGARLGIEDASGRRRAVPAAERGQRLHATSWPFRPTLALAPAAAPARSVLSLPVEIPAGAWLETAVGVHPERWFDYPPSAVDFGIRVVPEGGATVAVFEHRLDPTRELGDRGWVEVRVSLERFAGQSVRIELTSRCEGPGAEHLASAGFEHPRLVLAGAQPPLQPPATPSLPRGGRTEPAPSEGSEPQGS